VAEIQPIPPEVIADLELTPYEIEEFAGLSSEQILRELSDRPSENPSVKRCIRAWKRASHNKKAAQDASSEDIDDAGKSAFLRNMPPLDSFENVRDFIACVTFAEVSEVIEHYEAENLLGSAKVALAAVRHERKPQSNEPKKRGRPPKLNSAEKENEK
jgi:hypothetical protein